MLVTLAETMLPANLRTYLEASDLVQHTLMEAHSNAALLATFEEGPVFAWLRKALKHNLLHAIKHLKTQKHDNRRILRTTELDESFIRFQQLFVAGDTSPSQIAQRNEQISFMLAAIQELPENQRTAIIMKHLRGHSFRDVAKTIGLSESATAGLLHRGRQQLVRCLENVNQINFPALGSRSTQSCSQPSGKHWIKTLAQHIRYSQTLAIFRKLCRIAS